MDAHLPPAVVIEARLTVSTAHVLQAVRYGNWEVVWRHAAGTKGLLHSKCDWCPERLAIHSSGLLASRVTHRCPHRPREAHVAELCVRRGSAFADRDESYWLIRGGGDEGRTQAGKERELRLPLWDVPEEVPGLRFRELQSEGESG